jgi:endonuclease III
MAATASNRSVRIGKLHQALKKHYKPVELPRRPLLEQILFACCLEDATFDGAEEVLAKLIHGYFDWNEVRVTTVSELAEVMTGLPDPTSAATRLKKILHNLFEKHYSFDLENISKLALGKAIEHLESIPGMTPFVLGHVIQHSLGGHQIPLDDAALKVLELCEIASAADVAKRAVPGLERAIAKTKGIEFATLLHACAVDYRQHPQGTTPRAVILAVHPDALLPGSAAAKRLAAEQKKAAEKAAAEAQRVAAAKAKAEAQKAAAAAAKAQADAAKAAKAGSAAAAKAHAEAQKASTAAAKAQAQAAKVSGKAQSAASKKPPEKPTTKPAGSEKPSAVAKPAPGAKSPPPAKPAPAAKPAAGAKSAAAAPAKRPSPAPSGKPAETKKSTPAKPSSKATVPAPKPPTPAKPKSPPSAAKPSAAKQPPAKQPPAKPASPKLPPGEKSKPTAAKPSSNKQLSKKKPK